MDGFEDTLGRILGDPSAMARIASLAQSLGDPSPPPENGPPAGPTVPPPGTGTPPDSREAESSPPPPVPPPAGPPVPPPGTGSTPAAGTPLGAVPSALGAVPSGTPPGTGTPPLPDLSALAGLADSPLLRRLLPLLLEGRRNTEARRFLYALRPYLSPRRQENVERALQLARLIRVGRRFLSEGGGTAGRPEPFGPSAGTAGRPEPFGPSHSTGGGKGGDGIV